jgi:hypothetical protein
MRFRNCIISNEIDHAVKQVEKLLTPESTMIKELIGKDDFKYGAKYGADVVTKLLEYRDPINVYSYKPFNPFSSAVGYFDGKAIYISTKALNTFDFEKFCGLLLHEYAHYCGFKHGSNFPSGDKRKFSVPYYLSSNITKWV